MKIVPAYAPQSGAVMVEVVGMLCAFITLL